MSLPAAVQPQTIATSRLAIHALVSGDPDGIPLLLIHGNVSSGRFFAELMATLPASVRAVAPDLRGYGHTERAPIDATRGLGDFVDDLVALIQALGWTGRPIHVAGWSVGGGVALALAQAVPLASIVLLAPMSPYGFGGTRDLSGTPTSADWAGTGGGTANPDFVQRLAAGDTSDEADTSPRKILRAFYVKPSFVLPSALEDAYVDAMLRTATGDDAYPGDLRTCEGWPGVAPGDRGINNAISGRWCDVSGFVSVEPRPAVLWIRGADDQIVSDLSLFDFGALGQLGAVPGWPGADAFPPQPMVGQTRALLDRYAHAGGAYREVVLDDCGHGPHIERQDDVRDMILGHIGVG